MMKLPPAYLKHPPPAQPKKTKAQKAKEKEEQEAVARMAILKGGK
jgi:hypothetical protein